MFDLTIVAAGQSGLAEMFPLDNTRELAQGPSGLASWFCDEDTTVNACRGELPAR